MSNTTTESATTGDLWDVLLATGPTKMTVDQLDAAFQQGWIDASTRVRAPGAFEWTTLGAAAGLDGETETLVRDEPAAAASAESEDVAPLDEEDIETVLYEDEDRISWIPPKPRWKRKREIAIVAAFTVLMGAGIFATARWAGVFKQSLPPAAAITAAAAPATPEAATATQPPKPSSPGITSRTAAAKNPSARTPRHQPAKATKAKVNAKAKEKTKAKAKANAAKAKQPEPKKAKPAPKPAPRPSSTPTYGRLAGT